MAVALRWKRFSVATDARKEFAKIPCVYVQADPAGRPIRIGKASEGLEARYRGGTGYALDASMHGSGNLMFVAPVPKELCVAVENELIWRGRAVLPYNNVGKRVPPITRVEVSHEGDSPVFVEFEAPVRPGKGGVA